MRRSTSFGMLLGLMVASFASANSLCTSQTFVLVSDPAAVNGTIYNIGAGTFGVGNTGCTLGGLTFDGFQVAANAGYNSPGALSVNLSASGNTLLFGTNLSAGQDIEVEFRISPGVLGIGLTSGPGGGVNEVICSNQMVVNGVGAGSCGFVGGTTLGSGAVPGSGATMIQLTGNNVDWVFKDVSGVSEFDQTIVPEPMTLSLMGAGLVGLGFLRRYRKS